MANRWGKMETMTDFIFLGSKVTADDDCIHEINRHFLLGRKAMRNLDSVLKSRDISLVTKVPIVKAMIFPVVMYRCELCHKEGWVPKNWYFQTAVLERTLEVHFDYKKIKPVNPKENQPWIFIGRTDAAAEAPILWPPDAKSQLIGKGPDAGKDWGHEEKGMKGDKMVGWHHRLDGHEFEQVLGVGDGQGGLACCNPWVPKSQTRLSDWTELNWGAKHLHQVLQPN